MKEVFRHLSAARVSVYQSVLESAGIQTFVRNANTQQAIVGGLLTAIFPLPDFWPALCVVNDDAYPEAMALLAKTQGRETTAHPEWVCAQCGKSVPAHFAVCWNCGHAPGNQ
jgi:hypothetical protein